MRIAVIGAGLAGRSHLLDAVTNPRFDVAAVAAGHLDRARAAADQFGLPAYYDSVPRLLRDTAVDAVVVATPPVATPSILYEVLTNGCAALVDKPAAATAAGLTELAETLGEHTTRVVVGYNRRYQAHVHSCRDLLTTARPQRTRCLWAGPFTNRYRSTATYRHTAAWGHGVLLDTASHVLDTLLFLGLGPINVIAGRLTAGATFDADIEADLRLHLRDMSTGQVAIRDSDSADGDTWRLDVIADRGQLTLTRDELHGIWDDKPLSVAATNLRRPVDDLLALADGKPVCGASLPEATEVLRAIDTIRDHATTQSKRWQRPRAKALGRLNGAC